MVVVTVTVLMCDVAMINDHDNVARKQCFVLDLSKPALPQQTAWLKSIKDYRRKRLVRSAISSSSHDQQSTHTGLCAIHMTQNQVMQAARQRPLLGLLAVVGLSLLAAVQAAESNHRYKDSEPVILWVNKVGPYNNPQVRQGLWSSNSAATGAQCVQ